MKYIVIIKNVDSQGITVKDSLQEAKDVFYTFGITVYEATEAEVATIREKCGKDYKTWCDYLQKNCTKVYEE